MMSDRNRLIDWVDQIGINNFVWMTDLDLTLLDPAKDPNNVRAPEGLEETCDKIDQVTDGRFYIITGREMSFVNNVFPSIGFKASTEYHNVVRWDRDSETTELNAKPQWDLVDDEINGVLRKWWPEDFKFREKPFMRSIHYTHAPKLQDEDVKLEVKGALQAIFDRYAAKTGQNLINIDGGKVFDIAPEGSTKEKAAQDIMDHAAQNSNGQPLVPIYFGDSPGDLDAVPAIKAAGGVFVSVGDDPRVKAVADFHLDDTADCRALFKAVSELSPKPNLAPNVSYRPKI